MSEVTVIMYCRTHQMSHLLINRGHLGFWFPLYIQARIERLIKTGTFTVNHHFVKNPPCPVSIYAGRSLGHRSHTQLSCAGEKRAIAWVRHYLVVITSDGRSAAAGAASNSAAQSDGRADVLQVFDLRNKLAAARVDAGAPINVLLAAGDTVAVITDDGRLIMLRVRHA